MTNPASPLVPLWLMVLLAACLPLTLAGLHRLGRWWFSARPIPQPIDGPAPMVPWPAGTGLLWFVAMLLMTMLIGGFYVEAAKPGYIPWEPIVSPKVFAPGGMFSPGTFLAMILPSLAGLAMVLWYGHGAAEAVGLRFGRVGPDILRAAAVVAMILPICVVAFLVNTVLLSMLRLPPVVHPLLATVDETRGWWVLALGLVQAAVIAPATEEFIYRGILFRSVEKETGLPWALAISSIVFALVHLPTEPQAILALGALGLALGYLAHRTRSLLAPTAAHALFNGVMLVGAYFGEM